MAMALQIANPAVDSKVESLAKSTSLSRTALVERDVDRPPLDTDSPPQPDQQAARLTALLAQLDRIPDRPDGTDPLAWDEHGLAK